MSHQGLRNPLLANLIGYEALQAQLPKDGRHINATFTRDQQVIEPFLARCSTRVPAAASQLARDTGVIVVYQAFNKEIADFASQNQTFLGCKFYNPTRMTWIKTSYMWMMYRCEFATRDVNQARVVAITLPLGAFDEILRISKRVTDEEEQRGPRQQQPAATAPQAADAAEQDESAETSAAPAAAGQKKCSRADPTRLQWDPDHSWCGGKRPRRAIQLGMRGPMLELFHKSMLAIDDITDAIVAPNRPAKFALPAGRQFRIGGAEAAAADVANDARGADDGGAAAAADPATAAVGQRTILLPFEGVYVPSDLAIAAHIGLTVVGAARSDAAASEGDTA